MSTWEKATTEISLDPEYPRYGEIPAARTGWRSPSGRWFVFKDDYSPSSTHWNLTHVGSGMRVRWFKTRRAAQEVAFLCDESRVPWDRLTPTNSNAMCIRHRRAWLAILPKVKAVLADVLNEPEVPGGG